MDIMVYLLPTFFSIIRISSKNHISGVYTFIAKYYELFCFSGLGNFYFKNPAFSVSQFTVNVIKSLRSIYNSPKVTPLEETKGLSNTRVYQIGLTVNYLALCLYQFYLLRGFYFLCKVISFLKGIIRLFIMASSRVTLR